MSITSGSNRIDYVATSGQTVFPYNFRVDLASDFQVFQNGALIALDTEYSVDGLTLPGGGDVTFVTGAAVADEIIILRVLPITQLSDYILNEGFPSDRVEQDLDNLIMICQQISEKADRVLTTVTLQTGNIADRIVVYQSPTAMIGHSTFTYDGNEFKVGALTIDDEPGIIPVLRSDKSMAFRVDADDDDIFESFSWQEDLGTGLMSLGGNNGSPRLNLVADLTASNFIYNIGQPTASFSFVDIYLLGHGFFEKGIRTGSRTTTTKDYIGNAFAQVVTATGGQFNMTGTSFVTNLIGNSSKTDFYHTVSIRGNITTQQESATINEIAACRIEPVGVSPGNGGTEDTITDHITLLVEGPPVHGVNLYTLYVKGGVVRITDLAGSGSRTVVADANGVLSAP